MNKRTRELLRRLSEQKGRLTIEAVAKEFHVTERTVRNDLRELNDFLSGNGYQEVGVGKGGVLEPGTDIAETKELKVEEDIYTYRLSKEERDDIVAAILINASPSVTINGLADQLQVSRATITHALNGIKDSLDAQGLRVSTYSNKGLYVEGTEYDKRRALYRLVWKMADISRVDDLRFPHYPGIDLNQTVTPEQRKVICRIINEQEHLRETFLTDQSFAKLQCYIMVGMMRTAAGVLLESPPADESCYPLAEGLMSYISHYCGLVMSENEVRALSDFLATLRYTRKKSSPEIIRIQMVTHRYIAAVSETLQVNLTTDLRFYENLSNHLTSILKSDTYLDENPLVSQIADDYPNVFGAVRLHRGILEECCGRALSRVELEYIVVHICTAIERITNNQRELSVVLVCGSGVAASRLLYERLSRQFRVIAMFSSHDMEGIQNCGADLIISTVPLREAPMETVVVTPMLTKEDTLRIFAKTEEIRKRWNQVLRPQAAAADQPRQLLREIQGIIREETQEQDSPLLRRVTDELTRYFGLGEKGADAAPLLGQILEPELVQVDVPCRSWREAVELSARPLLDRGYFEARYVDRIFDIIYQNGPYMVMARELLVAHASFRDGTKKMGMNLVRLSDPVDFGEKDYQKGIRYVCCLSPVDSASHLQALMNLTNLFGDDDWRPLVDRARSPQEVLDVIRDYERQVPQEPATSLHR